MAEKLITKEEAVGRVTPADVDTLLHPQFTQDSKPSAKKEGRLLYFTGVNASPGAAVGQVYFDADLTEKMAKEQ